MYTGGPLQELGPKKTPKTVRRSKFHDKNMKTRAAIDLKKANGKESDLKDFEVKPCVPLSKVVYNK